MPISSKTIISYIKSLSTPFTVNHLIKKLINIKTKKKGKKKHIKGNDVNKITQVLQALVSIGYIYKHKKSYVKSPSFILKGIIKINNSGNGILITEDEREIIIKRDFMNRAHNNDLVKAEIIEFKRGLFFGQIKSILNRNKDVYFARVINKTRGNIHFQLLDTKGEPEACYKRHDKEPEIGDYAIVKMLKDSSSKHPMCSIEKLLSSDEEHDVQRIILKHSLPGPHRNYEELSNISEYIHQDRSIKRKDYRGLFTITIDGEDAKDFDDAISLETSQNEYKLYIHIADVSFFIKKDGELDLEAQKRGNSFYLSNHVIPMLPEILSNNLCSLREGEERFALSVEIVFDKNGKQINIHYHRGLIIVNKRLTYEEVDKIIQQNKKTQLGTLLQGMYTLAVMLRQIRRSEGRIDLSLEDIKINCSVDDVRDIDYSHRLKSHVIIEEFMLSANEVVSRTLRDNDIPTLYRVHESISDEKLLYLKNFLRSLNLMLKESDNIGIVIQRIIDDVAGKEYEQVVNFVILKSFMQAYYGVKPLGHFGLGFRDYTHFTSPIRRYPDLIVHRCLLSYIEKSPSLYNIDELKIIGEKSSEMERIAQSAERDLIKLLSCRLMSNRIGEKFNAIISGIAEMGFYVTLADKPIEGMVPLRYLTDDYYLVKEDEFIVVGKRLGKRFRLGDTLRVRLMDVNVDTMRIDFDVI
ncbi:MAG: ribonuclease R family protein [Spirochaetota bacterium]|nr:ribonuclease R family protein [Spirochaetota bacterium]